jgi:hypothetical protein
MTLLPSYYEVDMRIQSGILELIIVQWELGPVVVSNGIARLLHKFYPNVMVGQSVE